MPDVFEFFTASSGKVSARIRFADGSTRHIHSTVSPEKEGAYFKDLSFFGDYIIFAGIGLGYHLFNKLPTLLPHAVVIVIDYHEECISFCKSHLFNNLTNTIIFISLTTEESLLKSIRSSVKHSCPSKIQCIQHPASYHAHREFYDSVLNRIYPAVMHKKPSPAGVKKVLLLYGNFFLQNEINHALEQIQDRKPALFYYENHASPLHYEQALQESIAREKPDVIISINMKGFDGNGILAALSKRFSIPLAVWFVDDPHPILLHHAPYLHQNMRAFCWEKTFIPFLKRQKFGSVNHLPLATDPNLFFPDSRQQPSVDLGFIGTSMGGLFLEQIREKFLWNEGLVPLVEKTAKMICGDRSLSVPQCIRESFKESQIVPPFSDDRNFTWLCSYIIHYASMLKRQELIAALVPLGIETFGDPEGWKTVCGSTITTHPDIDYRTQLCNAYRDIAIHINTTSCQMRTTVNQRVFDIPASGSFVISDNQPDFSELFELEKEAVCWNSIEELKTKIRFYSTNSNARNEIIAAAQKRILAQHTYVHRIRTMLSLL